MLSEFLKTLRCTGEGAFFAKDLVCRWAMGRRLVAAYIEGCIWCRVPTSTSSIVLRQSTIHTVFGSLWSRSLKVPPPFRETRTIMAPTITKPVDSHLRFKKSVGERRYPPYVYFEHCYSRLLQPKPMAPWTLVFVFSQDLMRW